MISYLFVYGTLRGGLQHPESRWLSAHSTSMGTATTRGRLFRIAWYPGMVASAADRVVGEVLQLHDPDKALERLDHYEGVAEGEYERREVEVHVGEKVVRAWAYFYLGDTSHLRWIPSGDFMQDLNSHFD